ncbi:MAG: NAD-binding protein [Baekduia sp.]
MRALVVGGGRAGLGLAEALTADGHAVRYVTRDQSSAAAIEATGAEAWIADPDRIGTLRYALDNVTVLLWLLGTASAPELHGSRLTMMLEKTIDTTVRGFVYEAHPDHPEGAETVRRMATYNEIPFSIVDSSREDPERFTAGLLRAIETVLAGQRG